MKRITVRHILVSHEFEAKDLLRKIEGGSNFEELARDFSNCSSGNNGGLLPEFGRGKMVREFEKAAFSLKFGQVSAPIRTKFGYHLIKRES